MSTDSAAAAYPEPDVRPIVRTSPSGNRTLWIFGGLMLIATLLLEHLLNALLGWWWADSVAALVIAAWAVKEGVEAWRRDACVEPVGVLTGEQPTHDRS